MQLVSPQPYEEAVAKLGARSVVGSTLNSAEWRDVPVALRERAFFSSQVENTRFLQRAKDSLTDFLAGAKETLPDGRTVLKTGSRAAFVQQMRRFALAEGMGPLDPKDRGGLKDILSEKRLSLIFDIQTKAAKDFGRWKQGMDPAVLDEFPAQRFVRVRRVKKPRPFHQAALGTIRLKTDTDYWVSLNPDFGVPWGPWGFGPSGCDVEDVDRRDAEGLKLINPGERPAPVVKSFNDGLEASLTGLDEPLRQRLKKAFGDQVEVDGEAARWRGKGERPASPAPAGEDTPRPAPEPSPAPAPAPGEQAPVEPESPGPRPALEGPPAHDEEPVVLGPHFAPQPPAEPARPGPEAVPASAVVELRLSPDLQARGEETLRAIDGLHAVGAMPVLPFSDLPASAYEHGRYDPRTHTAGVHPESDRAALTVAHEFFHGQLDQVLVPSGRSLRDPDKARRSMGEGALYEWYQALTRTPTAVEISGDFRRLRRGAGGEYARYLLRPEEMLCRSYAQYLALRSGAPTLLAELESYRQRARQETWSLEEFGPILAAVDRFLSEQGWR